MSDDPLFERLRDLPTRPNRHDPEPAARAAFDTAFGHAREPEPPLGATELGANGTLVARVALPAVLAAIVVVYLLWSFSAAFTLLVKP